MKNNLKTFLKKHNIPENQKTGGYLDLRSLTSIPEGFNPTVGSYLYLSGLTSIPEGFNPTVGGSLYLSGLTSIPEGFNPTVGGYLDLRSLTSIPEGFNPTVGGSLDLRRLTSIAEGFNPKVQYGICIKHKTINSKNKFTQGEVGNGWIYADDILTHITGQSKKIDKYTFYIGKIPKKNVITDGVNFAHCNTVRNGIIDLRFKAENRDKSQYEDLTLESEVSFEDAVIMYRVITGACRQGTEQFISSLKETKDKYSVREIIKITENQYNNHELRKFFNKC